MLNSRVISFLVQALVVIVAVFIFSFFDPFNIFNSRKLRSRETPTVVEEIKGMGKLITAEYYGEVIKSTGEEIFEEIDSVKREHRARLISVYEDLEDALGAIAAADKDSKRLNRFQIYSRLKAGYDEIVNNPDYEIVIRTIRKNTGETERVIIRDMFFNELRLKRPKRAADTTQIRALFDAYLHAEYDLDKRERRKISNYSIVLLGRGWVKAGIDFSKFDTKHMDYDQKKNRIRLYYHQPEIISATINPWFIPEKKIRGFEYLFVGNKLDNRSNQETAIEISTKLKKACLENLKADARGAGIMQEARKNAESTLSSFFSLILDKTITVEIYGSPLEAQLQEMLSKKTFEGRELYIVDTLIAGSLKRGDLANTIDFVDQLYDSLARRNQLPKPWANAGKSWDVLARYYMIADDGFYSDLERDSLNVFIKRTDLTLKEWLYWSAGSPFRLNELRKAKYNIKDLPGRSIDSLQQSRQAELDELKKAAAAFRRTMNATELTAADKELETLIAAGDLTKAYEFLDSKSHIATTSVSWPHATHNWQLLAMYQQVYDPEFNLDTALAALKRSPSKELMYYLFYDSTLPAIMKSKSQIQATQANLKSKAILENLKKVLDREFNRNVEDLRAHKKTIPM